MPSCLSSKSSPSLVLILSYLKYSIVQRFGLPTSWAPYPPIYFLWCCQKLGFLKFKLSHVTFTLQNVSDSNSPRKSIRFALLFKMPAIGFDLMSLSYTTTRRHILGLSNSTNRKGNGISPLDSDLPSTADRFCDSGQDTHPLGLSFPSL